NPHAQDQAALGSTTGSGQKTPAALHDGHLGAGGHVDVVHRPRADSARDLVEHEAQSRVMVEVEALPRVRVAAANEQASHDRPESVEREDDDEGDELDRDLTDPQETVDDAPADGKHQEDQDRYGDVVVAAAEPEDDPVEAAQGGGQAGHPAFRTARNAPRRAQRQAAEDEACQQEDQEASEPAPADRQGP